MSMSTKVVVQFNGTEVSVKLSPNSSAKVFIDGAKFDIRPTRRVRPKPVQTRFSIKKLRIYRNPTWRNNNLPNYAFIDTPREETVNLPNYAFIDPVQTRFYMKKYAFIDTPREEIITLPNYAFIDRLQTGFLRTAAIIWLPKWVFTKYFTTSIFDEVTSTISSQRSKSHKKTKIKRIYGRILFT